MSLAAEITTPTWTHSEADSRIEDLAAHNPDLGEVISKIALRFISEKGLSSEFADLLQEIEATQEPPYIPTLDLDEPE